MNGCCPWLFSICLEDSFGYDITPGRDKKYFLKCDLSGADLLFCDGLQNITDFSDLNLTNARLKSNILDMIGVNYETAIYEDVNCPVIVQNNEIECINALTTERLPLED